jgi:hypothetical protein
VHRTFRVLGKSRGVIGMGVGDHDCGRIDPSLVVEPIGAAIDHHAPMTEPHQQSAVAEMAARPDLDLAAGAEKGELDAALLALLIAILFSFFSASGLLGNRTVERIIVRFFPSLLSFFLTVVKCVNGTPGTFSVWTT